MPLESIFSLIQTVMILIIVIFLANFTLKYLNKHMSANNKIVKIIERVAVNKNSYISVVEISGKYYLMSFNENSNEILKELDKKEIKELLEEFEDEGRVNYLDIQKKIYEKLHNFRNNHNRSNDANSTDGFGPGDKSN